MSIFAELKRRNVFRVALLYLAGSWLMLQIGDLIFPILEVPDWSMRLVLGLLALGLPIAIIGLLAMAVMFLLLNRGDNVGELRKGPEGASTIALRTKDLA